MRSIGITGGVSQLTYIARDAAAEPDPGPTIAVVFSAFWLEGYVNQLFETLAWYADTGTSLPRRLQGVADVGTELERQRAQLPEKVQILSMELRGRTFDRGSTPYQDFDLLLAIRHRIVHPRPYRLAAGRGLAAIDEPRKIRQGLIDRGILDRSSDAKMPWSIALVRPEFGLWAFNTSYAMGRAIADCFPRGQWRRWAHERNPLTPESTRQMRRATLVPRPEPE
jgi:hypothetical protein